MWKISSRTALWKVLSLDGCVPQLSSSGFFHWRSSRSSSVEKVHIGKEKLLANSCFCLPMGYLPHMQQDQQEGVELLQPSVSSSVLHFRGKAGDNLHSRGLPLPQPAVIFKYRAWVSSSDAKPCNSFRGIFLREKVNK